METKQRGGLVDARGPAVTLTSSAAAVPQARRWVRDKLAECNVSPAPLADAELLVSELVTNAVRHVEGSPVTVEVIADGEVIVRVSDNGREDPTQRDAGPLEESGRGLQIVEAVAQRWGVERRTGSKSVWFALA